MRECRSAIITNCLTQGKPSSAQRPVTVRSKAPAATPPKGVRLWLAILAVVIQSYFALCLTMNKKPCRTLPVTTGL